MRTASIVLCAALIGCSGERPAARPVAPGVSSASDADKVRDADYSILFVGNSHTGSC